jgi:hypothetical protein
VCAACADGVAGGSETAVDCGGVCGPCGVGLGCGLDADCQSGICEDGLCCGGNREHCTRCARRLSQGLDCALGLDDFSSQSCDALLQCFADNAALCPARFAPGCSDPGDVCDPDQFGGVFGPGAQRADAILGTAGCVFN